MLECKYVYSTNYNKVQWCSQTLDCVSSILKQIFIHTSLQIIIKIYLLHSVPLMQTFATVSITCPLGQTHCGTSQNVLELGSLQEAFAPSQSSL